MKRPPLVIAAEKHLAIPLPRGRLMDARSVAAELFDGTVTEKWVREHVPGRIKLSHRTIRWYRDDVLRWIDERRDARAKR
jgi:predicted DNA-binding transcriptional regulator AlpA